MASSSTIECRLKESVLVEFAWVSVAGLQSGRYLFSDRTKQAGQECGCANIWRNIFKAAKSI